MISMVVSGVRSSCRSQRWKSGVGYEEIRADKRGSTHKEVVVDGHHGRIAARTQALDLDQRKLSVGRRLAWRDAELVLERLQNRGGPAPA